MCHIPPHLSLTLVRCCGTGTLLIPVCLRRIVDPSLFGLTTSGFISSSWHITSDGMFAGSCVGVILLVISLEFLRRLGKEYDRYILRQHKTSLAAQCIPALASAGDKSASVYDTEITPPSGSSNSNAHARNMSFRPNILQQMIRATLHMVQFAVAYFIMLLAMYYNGYFIICIFIGAWIGAFAFSWEQITFV